MKKLMKLPSSWRFLAAIYLMFVCKGLFYSILFPIWEGYDEYAHFGFIQFAATHRELPVPETVVSNEINQSLELVPLPWLLRDWPTPHMTHDAYWRLSPEERMLRQKELRQLTPSSQAELGKSILYEGQQGPLYYWLMAPVHSALHSAWLPTRIFIFRAINIFLASLLIPITFKAAQLLFFDERLALCSCLLLVAMPELYIDSARVGNQTLAMVLYGALTLLCLVALDGKPRYLVIGTTLGLLLLTKAYALAAIPAVCFAVIWAAHRWRKSEKWLCLPGASLACSAIVAAWWYVRNFQLVGTIIWVDGAPAQRMQMTDLIRRFAHVDWLSSVRSLAGSYIWFGNWSFLTVRSWMYEVVEAVMLIIVIGAAIEFVRSLRLKPDSTPVPQFILVLLLYAGFVAALVYHVFVNSINNGLAATCGWYLYAVALPGALIAATGIKAFGRSGNLLLITVVGALVALELYATHWLLIPYYSGLIAHAANGGLQSFYPLRTQVPLTELLSRLQINRPLVGMGIVLSGSWFMYLVSTVGIFYVTVRLSRTEGSFD